MKHLYVHIPFCRSRCAYCDFASEPIGQQTGSGRMVRYLRALREELEQRLDSLVPAGARPLETIYVGGGTPTVLPHNQLLSLCQELSAKLVPATPERGAATQPAAPRREGGAGRAPAAPEFTVEANPGTINPALLGWLAEAGVTRLSIGVQSFSAALRSALGRFVSQTEISEALAAIRETGWKEWNLDLVFGIPGQDWKTAAADIDSAVAAGPTHISMYDLTYTPTFRARLETNTPETYAAFTETFFAEAVARLEAAGYRRYEVSNFAQPGHECRHNQAYWRGEDYVGVGVSAVSTLGAERRTNPRTVDAYLGGEPPEIEVLPPEIRLWEKAMLGLRTIEGVDEEEVWSVLDTAARERLLAQGCLESRYGKLRLNTGFLDVSNAIIAALLIHPRGSWTQAAPQGA